MAIAETLLKGLRSRFKGRLGVDSNNTHLLSKQGLKRLSWAHRAYLRYKMFAMRCLIKLKG